MGVGRLVGLGLGLGLGLGAPTAARADVVIDWAAGVVTAPGVGLADRQAPNPAVARGTSRRKAEDAARAVLAAALPKLPIASGGTLGDKLADPAIKRRFDRAIELAYGVSAEPETDGAWRVRMAVPIEALRQVVTGPRALAATATDAGPAVVVVEGVAATPAIGAVVGGVEAATVWVDKLPSWAVKAPRVKAKAGAGGVIEAAVTAGPGTLFVLVTK